MSAGKPAAIVDTSRLIIQKGSRSFSTAARLFDQETRDNTYMLYAWCRHCDDVIDNQELGFNCKPQSAQTTQLILAELREKTQAAINNVSSDDELFEGLRYVLMRNRIPGRYPLELLDGFAMDATAYVCRTLGGTLQYCYYVAGVVGIMMAYVMGTREPAALQRAMDLGIAFQLTNIARDVREDFEIGRIYLPGDWLAEAGVPRGELLHSRHSKALAAVVKRLLGEAARYYSSADEGLRALNFRSAWAVATARDIYSAIGEIVQERGEQALQERVVVRNRRKILGLAEGILHAAKASLVDRYTIPMPRDKNLWTLPRLFE